MSQGTAPSGLSADGATWQLVKTVRLAGGTLTVRLTDGGLPGDLVSVMAADAVRVQRIEGDRGADDDFHLMVGSPAVARGDPLSAYIEELQPNGARVDLGAYGNSVEATASPEQLIQVLGPNGLDKIEAVSSYRVTWVEARRCVRACKYCACAASILDLISASCSAVSVCK